MRFLVQGLRRRAGAAALALVAIAGLAGCATNSPQNEALGVYDPYESINRDVHAFNVGADRLILRPTATAYDAVTPEIVRFVVQNALSHLELPRDFANHLLTGELRAAGRTFVRFAVNSTIGFGGLLDPASDAALEREPTDFGRTLALYGAGPGAYWEVPLLGPTTTRDAYGAIVDIAFAPTTYVLAPFSGIATGVVSAVEVRAANAQIIDDVLYSSEDSYATARSVYLQRREAFISGGSDFSSAVSFDG